MKAGDLLTDPALLRKVLAQGRALSRLELVTVIDGVTTRSPLRLTRENAVLACTINGVATPEPPERELDPETIVWRDGILARGGTLSDASITLADELIVALKAETFTGKLVYLLPFLGSDIVGARMPLRDTRGVGIATNSGFTNSDFSESTGLQGGGTKYLDTLLRTNLLNNSDVGNGGIGVWEMSASPLGGWAGGGVIPDGANASFCGLRMSTPEVSSAFYWNDGVAANQANLAEAPTRAHYYGQRSSASSRVLYKNGSSAAVNTTADPRTMTSSSATTIGAMAWHTATAFESYWPGRLGVFYLTDGTLTASEVNRLHSLLDTYLIAPTGR